MESAPGAPGGAGGQGEGWQPGHLASLRVATSGQPSRLAGRPVASWPTGKCVFASSLRFDCRSVFFALLSRMAATPLAQVFFIRIRRPARQPSQFDDLSACDLASRDNCISSVRKTGTHVELLLTCFVATLPSGRSLSICLRAPRAKSYMLCQKAASSLEVTGWCGVLVAQPGDTGPLEALVFCFSSLPCHPGRSCFQELGCLLKLLGLLPRVSYPAFESSGKRGPEIGCDCSAG